jgi:hypothetical protein
MISHRDIAASARDPTCGFYLRPREPVGGPTPNTAGVLTMGKARRLAPKKAAQRWDGCWAASVQGLRKNRTSSCRFMVNGD